MAALKISSARKTALAATAAVALATTAMAQQAAAPVNSVSTLNLPQNPQLFGTTMPSVVKATAIVNGQVITQTDIDQRLALLAMANGGRIPAEEVGPLRQQILSNLIDELLQIQDAKKAEVEVKPADIDRALERVAQQNKQTVDQLGKTLVANGSSLRTMRRQIEGEIAWQRLLNEKIESDVTVGEDEVNAVISRLQAAKGTDEYKVSEIFLPATSVNRDQVSAGAARLVEQIREGASFAGLARNYSQATTAVVGGDLGWIRPERLPDPLPAALRQLQPGQVSDPIPVSGGFSIVAVQDARKVLTNDPRDAVLSLKQVALNFAPGSSQAERQGLVERFSTAARNVGGCGGADKLAADFKADLVQRDEIKMRDLPPALQNIMLAMQVGQATQPFGSLNEGVRTFVLCGRDQVAAQAPSYDEIYAATKEDRVNLRARRYLRDLRRDAIIEYR
ncbi:peptidylprolyl isomerase [Sphingomonas piscis]|uniref:peptidylprolyl isomerase n=1 Tax=Sphingomonas piscis TaxID=2714943 RepID=UPI001FEA121D|nr:peptidylprolyl isomerase [Sphingomonas piscis]